MDSDAALIRLWDGGVDVPPESEYILSDSNLRQARRILGIPDSRDLRSPEYWMEVFSLNVSAFHHLLARLNICMSRNSRKLPRGAIRKLKAEARKANILSVPDVHEIVSGMHPVKSPECRELVHQNIEWCTIGKERQVTYLNTNNVSQIHNMLVKEFSDKEDPIDPPGVRDPNLLESAIIRPQTASNDTKKYPSVEMAAAALVHSLVHNHPFHNGNKRTALVAMLVFLDQNNFMATCSEEELFSFVLLVAKHKICGQASLASNPSDLEVQAMSRWLSQNVRVIERGERPLPFHELRRILEQYGCVLEYGSSGSKIDIRRVTISERDGFFRGKREERIELHTNIWYGGEGREVDKNTLNKVRKDLHLDEEHGIDTPAFYYNGPIEPDQFIVRHSRILRRLAKL
jgi:death-on-curing family protein